MPGPIITAAVAIGKAIAGSKIATAAVITAASAYGTAKYASWQQAKRRRELENQRPDPGRYQLGDEEPYAPFVYGMAKVPGFPFYASSAYDTFTTFQVLSFGPCEGLCGDDASTANPMVVLNGTEVVRCRRITMAAGDRIVPIAGTKYDGALEIREYFLADGSQGSAHRRTSPLATYTTPEFAPGPDGPWDENYHEGDGYVREAATPTTPAGDPTSWATGIPVWSAAHRVQGYAWVAVTYTQKTRTVDGQQQKVYQGDWPTIEFVMLGRKIAPYGSTVKTWTNNAARVRYDFLREIRGYSDSQIDQASYTAAVTLCGQTLDARTAGQTALPAPYDSYTPTFTRYTIDGSFRSNEDPADIEGQMDLAWAGSVVEDGGVHYFEPGADAVSKYTIGADDLLITDSLVSSPHPTVNERDNAVQARIEQSGDHGLRPLDLPVYEDAAAIARDGAKRVAAVSFRFVRDPIRATWLQRVNLARQRETDTKFLTVAPSTDAADYSRLAMRPVERATLTLPEHGVAAKRYEVVKVTLHDDLSMGLELTEDQDGTYGVTLGTDGVYRVPLGLPPLPEPRFEFPPTIYDPDITGLETEDIAIGTRGGVELHLDASVDPQANVFAREFGFQHLGYGQVMETARMHFQANELEATAQYETFLDTARMTFRAHEWETVASFKSLFDTARMHFLANEFDAGGVLDWKDETPDIDTGLLFKATGLTVYFTARTGRTLPSQIVPNRRDFTFTGNEGHKEGFWLYHPDLTAQTNDTAILGTNLKFERIGTESRGSWTDVGDGRGGRARLRIDFEKALATDARDDLTAAQRAALRFVFVNRATDTHRVRTIPVADIVEPYVWPDNVDLRDFLAAARTAGQTIDLYVVDTRAKFTGADAFRHHGFTGRVVTFDSARMHFQANELEAGSARYSLHDPSLVPSFASGLLWRTRDVRFGLDSDDFNNVRWVGDYRSMNYDTYTSTAPIQVSTAALHVSATRMVAGAGNVEFQNMAPIELTVRPSDRRIAALRFNLPAGHGLSTSDVQNWALVFADTASNWLDTAMGSSNCVLAVSGNAITFTIRPGARGPEGSAYTDLRRWLYDTMVNYRVPYSNFLVRRNPARTMNLTGRSGILDALCIVDTTNSGVNLTAQPFSARSG